MSTETWIEGVAIILAAGASRRLGRPKQLVELEGQTLLQRTISRAEDAGAHPIVVLGAHRDIVEATLPTGVERLFNPSWEEGMGTSLVQGVRAAMKHNPDYLLVCVGDQPFVSSEDLKRLVHAWRAWGVDASAAFYDDLPGTPACFDAKLANALLALGPKEGARKLLRSPRLEIGQLPMPEAAFDIDTPEDVAEALRRTQAPPSITRLPLGGPQTRED